MKKVSSTLTSLLLAGGLGLLTTGCVSTFSEVKPLSVAPPPTIKPKALALGQFKVCDTRLNDLEKQAMAQALQNGVEKWCAEHNSLELLKNVELTNLPPSAVLLEGTITEVEKGSAAARILIGMGAGQQRALGEFTVRGAEGARLAAFTARQSYLGGQAIGGLDELKLEDLVGRLGELAAATTDKWIKGGKIK